MPKIEKLKQNYEFRRLYNKGTACVTSGVIIYYKKGQSNKIRLGLTAGKKLGGAVERNRAKRVMYAAFSSCLPELKIGYDYVLVARNKILCMKSTQVAALIRKHLKNSDVWCENNENSAYQND